MSGEGSPTSDTMPAVVFLRTLWQVLDRPFVRWVALGVASCLLLATGVFGVGRGDAGLLGGGFDFDYLYYAGKLWLEGQSPYVVLDYQRVYGEASAFAYPPIVAPLCIFLALFPHDAAELLLQALNITAALFVVWGGVELSGPRSEEQRRRVLWLSALVVLSSPFVSHVVWMGQTSLIGAALVVAAFVAYQRERPALAGVLAALALGKPQLALLPVLWLSVKWDKRFLSALVLAGVASVAWPLIAAGPLSLPGQYLDSVSVYQKSPFQAASFSHMFGLKSAAASVGLDVPNLGALTLLLGVVLYAQRQRLHTDADVLALLLGSSLLLLFAHDYDLVALAVAVPALYRHLSGRPYLGVACLVALALLYFPQRFLLPLDMPWLLRYRELLCLGYLLLLGILNFHQPRAQEVRSALT